MGAAQHNHDGTTASAFAEVVRRQGRRHREDQARYASLFFDSYRWEPSRIQEALELDRHTLARILAADGVLRCTDCAFASHRSCTGYREAAVGGELRPCECECRSACRV